MAFLLVIATGSGSAESTEGGGQNATRSARVAAAQALQLRVPAIRSAAGNSLVVGKNSGFGLFDSRPLLPMANEGRTYPPSCLAEPLPKSPVGPFSVSASAQLAARDSRTGALTHEHVTIVVWRIACSGSRRPQSITLFRIFRDSENNGNEDTLLLFPDIRISQGALSYEEASTGHNWLRMAEVPNTRLLRTLVDTPIVCSTTYVLESPPPDAGGIVDLNQAFRLRVDSLLAENNQYELEVPAYVPDDAYPSFALGMPISVYMTGNWFDPEASGEGLMLQIFDVPGERYTPTLSFIWATFDPLGKPYWLYGQGNYLIYDTGVDSTLAYLAGGSFAGAGSAAGPPQIWGTARMTFPDCNHMRLTFNANPGLPASVPQGSGSRILQRVADTNALPCE